LAPEVGHPDGLDESVPVRRRIFALVALIVGLALAAIGTVVLVRPQQDPTPGAQTTRSTGTAVTPAPFQIRLQDDGTTLTVSWTLDRPAAVVIALAVGRDGTPNVVGTAPPGTDRYTIRGLDPRLEYCVIAGPVDDSAAVSPAVTECTRRTASR